MATVNGTVSFPTQTKDEAVKVVWTAMANGDAGAPFEWLAWADRSIQVNGTFGTGGTIVWQGSNDGTNWFSLTDPQGNAISKTAAALEQVSEVTQYCRPSVTAGDGTTSLTATLIARRK